MRIYKILLWVFAVVCFVPGLTACSETNEEYEVVQGFERHFIPEEYDSEYNTISEKLTLDAGNRYQLQLNAGCESGTMEIRVMCGNADEKQYHVDSGSPCNELLTIPENTSGAVTIIISIQPDTKGDVTGDLLGPA